MSGEFDVSSLISFAGNLASINKKKFIILSRFWLLLRYKGWIGFNESVIKKGKFVTKICFIIMLNEEVLKSCEKWLSAHDVKTNVKQLWEIKNQNLVASYKFLYKTLFEIHNQSAPETCFGSYFQKGKIFPFGKESIFLFRKNHPLLDDTKFRLLLCMLLVLRVSRNISFSDSNHISKFITKGFENLPSSFSLIPKICYQVLSSTRGCIYTSCSRSFIQTFTTRWQVIMVLPHEIDLILVRTVRFSWIDIFIR